MACWWWFAVLAFAIDYSLVLRLIKGEVGDPWVCGKCGGKMFVFLRAQCDKMGTEGVSGADSGGHNQRPDEALSQGRATSADVALNGVKVVLGLWRLEAQVESK